MTSLKSIMDRRPLQVVDARDMKHLKGGRNKRNGEGNGGGGMGLPPDQCSDD
ncbi:MAG: hypothetical protein AAF573_07675 [Bacteroidota bacterium]